MINSGKKRQKINETMHHYIQTSLRLKKLLEEKKCFKLICGAGNENLDEVERLVALYAAAGCHFFDLCPSKEVLEAAQKGLFRGLDFIRSKTGRDEEQKDYHFCLSVGTKNDPHMNKARINSEKCKRCEQCIVNCPQKAINQYFKVVEKNCIGCLKCKSVCNHGAIEIYSKPKPFNLLAFHPFQSFNFSCIELHASGQDELETDEKWEYLCQNFDGFLSLCIGRLKLSDEQVLARIKRLVDKRKPYTTIIQADGDPMSGGEDDYATTLPAVMMAKIVQSANLPIYLLLSGGTNSKTAELARQHCVDFNGIAIGSYARKIVKEYIQRADFLTNTEIFEEALGIAQKLIKSTE